MTLFCAPMHNCQSKEMTVVMKEDKVHLNLPRFGADQEIVLSEI
jgi:hypothetical protein